MALTVYRITSTEGHALQSAAQEQMPAGFVTLPQGDRQDWGTYAAVRAFFLNEIVDEDALYGFVSADFSAQTGLGLPQITQFVDSNPGNEAYVFFPFAHDAACFLNVFEEGEFHHPGLRDLAQRYLNAVGLSLDLREFVSDFRTSARAGYIVAKPVFWKTWFDLSEQVFALAETGTDELATQLNAVSNGIAPVPMKVLLVDRLASLVLALDQQLRTAVFDPFALLIPLPDQPLPRGPGLLEQLARLDTFKRDYLAGGDITLIDEFLVLRNRVLEQPEQPEPPAAPDAVAAIDANAELVYGCITHVELPIPFPDFVLPIYLGESQADGRLNLRELAPRWLPYHPIVGGMVGNFALRNYILAHYPNVQRIGICMYRKFVSCERISGVPAQDNWLMDVISARELERQSFDSMLDPGESKLLLGRPCGFTVHGEAAGYLQHYASAHHAEDLLRFAAEAVEQGVLQPGEADQFLNEKSFFMGGVELGVFPAAFWLQSIGDIEAVVWACVQRYQVKREGYQSRAWAFCAERLGSYMVLRLLRSLGPDDAFGEFVGQFVGQLNLITQDDQVLYVPSS